jgi:hypothetical protein
MISGFICLLLTLCFEAIFGLEVGQYIKIVRQNNEGSLSDSDYDDKWNKIAI